ncbi:MAG: methyltransferase domain-containing protein [Prevotellaceae bacterium]|jgi:SAM-dependent methyltransferase|nr:methyltransferase domain-containing protein [Prevotellaceae bacterium]
MKQIIRFFLKHVPRKYLQLFAQLVTRTISVFYIGDKVECTVCCNHYHKFLPYGYGKLRENALCPHCLALERHRLIQLYLQNKTDFYTANPKVLHVAPEFCFIKRFEKLLDDNYITADLESPLAKVKMDVQDIPFPDNSFDVILCNHIMEHVDNDLKALQELCRVLRPGGWGIIQSPVNYSREITYEDPCITTPEERARHFGQCDHLREFGADYGKRLEKGGFIVVEDDYVKTLPKADIIRYALPANEIIYLVRK